MNTYLKKDKYDRRFMFYFLASIISIGCQTIKKLDKQFERLSDVLDMDAETISEVAGFNEMQTAEFINKADNVETIYTEYKAMEKSDVKLYLYDDDEFPDRLHYINQSPSHLFVKGELPKAINPSVAIVGSRAATSYGTSIAEYYAESLANEGVEIISGMAIGIDAAAHRGALLSERGKTYAVLGGGVNIVYPKDNYYLYSRMTEENRGGVISELCPYVAALSRNFPMRNRIISGLADIVLVVEAREKSGSLITVEYAIDQNKDIMAVPGRVSDPMSRGTNQLIAGGAKMANSPEDVLDCLHIAVHGEVVMPEKNINSLDNKQKMVYSTLDSSPKYIDQIVDESKLTHQEVMEALVEMELRGLITQVSTNYYGK